MQEPSESQDCLPFPFLQQIDFLHMEFLMFPFGVVVAHKFMPLPVMPFLSWCLGELP